MISQLTRTGEPGNEAKICITSMEKHNIFKYGLTSRPHPRGEGLVTHLADSSGFIIKFIANGMHT